MHILFLNDFSSPIQPDPHTLALVRSCECCLHYREGEPGSERAPHWSERCTGCGHHEAFCECDLWTAAAYDDPFQEPCGCDADTSCSVCAPARVASGELHSTYLCPDCMTWGITHDSDACLNCGVAQPLIRLG